jgi:hypothetical protein
MEIGVLNLNWIDNKWTFKAINSFFLIVNNSLYFGIDIMNI